MDERISKLIDGYTQELTDMLCRWVEVPSVRSEAVPGAPFGPEVRRMLDTAEADIRAMGFPTRNWDGYAMDALLGSAEQEQIAVLGHLDVVPAGDGWQTPPFQAVKDGDRIYARGTSDDKGPVIASLFAMKAIRDAGVPLKRSVRLILGCDEESDWGCMDYYTAHTDMPEMGFSPDASFPLINTEKAMLKLILDADAPQEGLKVKRLWVGERMNVIPGEAEALVEGDQAVAERVAAYAEKTGLPYEAKLQEDGVLLLAHGIPGHSAYPQGRRNAIGMLLLLLRELGASGVWKTLADTVGMESDGRSVGCAYADDLSGATTCNMGILHLDGNRVHATLDMRVPVTADLAKLEANARAALQGIRVEASTTAPHHVPADSELVTKLMEAYREETGERDAQPQYTGGGTYAKVLRQGVAYGAAFPQDEDLAHQAGEYATVSGLIRAAKIYASALLKLCAAQ